jgi:predicted  nucleic acid-binding Zn-ribbon protein
MANDLISRSKTMQSNLQEYSKISINYDKSIFRLYKHLHETEKEYLAFKGNLNRKKDRIYPEVNKW